MRFGHLKKIHMVGIGGSGMSGIAEVLLNTGYEVSGSDIKQSDITDRLARLGADIHIGHTDENVGNADVVVYSTAVDMNNPELSEARVRGIPCIERAEMLAELMRMKQGIAIAGTHGKSTTTSLVGEVVSAGGLDPTIVVGGRVVNLENRSSKVGSGEYMVVEADEFGKAFLHLSPTIAVVTTMEREHMECYEDIEDLHKSFIQFMNKVPFYGAVVLCLDERALQEIMPFLKRKVITYGISTQSNIRATHIEFNENRTTFHLEAFGEKMGGISSRLIGLHNVRNTLAAIAVGLELNIPIETIRDAIANFKGVYRRFQILGKMDDIIVVDDFAHHPTEIRATLDAAKAAYNRRIVAVFQPHLYSRTRDFASEFGQAFLNSDILIVTRIYPAREKPIPGITAELVAQAARDFGHRNVHYIPERDTISDKLLTLVQQGDMVITLGAGDIYRVAEQFMEKYAESNTK